MIQDCTQGRNPPNAASFCLGDKSLPLVLWMEILLPTLYPVGAASEAVTVLHGAMTKTSVRVKAVAISLAYFLPARPMPFSKLNLNTSDSTCFTWTSNYCSWRYLLDVFLGYFWLGLIFFFLNLEGKGSSWQRVLRVDQFSQIELQI